MCHTHPIWPPLVAVTFGTKKADIEVLVSKLRFLSLLYSKLF